MSRTGASCSELVCGAIRRGESSWGKEDACCCLRRVLLVGVFRWGTVEAALVVLPESESERRGCFCLCCRASLCVSLLLSLRWHRVVTCPPLTSAPSTADGIGCCPRGAEEEEEDRGGAERGGLCDGTVAPADW